MIRWFQPGRAQQGKSFMSWTWKGRKCPLPSMDWFVGRKWSWFHLNAAIKFWIFSLFWTSINQNMTIALFCAFCKDCNLKKPFRSTSTSRPCSFRSWKRLHIDYWGPSFDSYYTLVVIEAYSKWREVFRTWSASAEGASAMKSYHRWLCRTVALISLQVQYENGLTLRVKQTFKQTQDTAIGSAHLESGHSDQESSVLFRTGQNTLVQGVQKASPNFHSRKCELIFLCDDILFLQLFNFVYFFHLCIRFEYSPCGLF